MKDMRKYITGIEILIPILCIVCGVILLVSPGSTARMICRSVGILTLVYGIMDLIRYLPEDPGEGAPSGFLKAIAKTICGLMLLIVPGTILSLISVAIGLLLMAAGIYGVRVALDHKVLGTDDWKMILGMSVIGTAVSLALIFSRISATNLILRLVGIALIAWGGMQLWPVLKKKL